MSAMDNPPPTLSPELEDDEEEEDVLLASVEKEEEEEEDVEVEVRATSLQCCSKAIKLRHDMDMMVSPRSFSNDVDA